MVYIAASIKLFNIFYINLFLQSHDDRINGASPDGSLQISRNSSICGSFSGRYVTLPYLLINMVCSSLFTLNIVYVACET